MNSLTTVDYTSANVYFDYLYTVFFDNFFLLNILPGTIKK